MAETNKHARMAATSKLDPHGMRDCVLDWPSLFEQGYGDDVRLPKQYHRAKQIVFCGMGASSIGAGMLGDYLAPELRVPYVVHREYGVPGFVGEDTLVVCISHSGTTEETLSAYDEAKRRSAMLMAVTTGGELAKRAKSDDVPLVQYRSSLEPRAAMPQVLGTLLRMAAALGVTGDQDDIVKEALSHLRQTVKTVAGTKQHAAAELAGKLYGRVPIVYGSGLVAEAARRFKGQISENAKQTAAWEVLPEQNHNAIVGFQLPERLPEDVVFVTIRTGHEPARIGLRFEFIDGILAERGLAGASLRGSGPNRLSHLLTAVFLGDLASVLLAERNEVDPTPVDAIKGLKARLSEAT